MPFHLRHGKRLDTSHQRVTVTFRPDAARALGAAGFDVPDGRLTIELDDPATVPSTDGAAHLGDDRADSAHERLMLAAIAGDHTWFAAAAGLRRVWSSSRRSSSSHPPSSPTPPGHRALRDPTGWRSGDQPFAATRPSIVPFAVRMAAS